MQNHHEGNTEKATTRSMPTEVKVSTDTSQKSEGKNRASHYSPTLLQYCCTCKKAKHNIWGGVRHGQVSALKALGSTNTPVNVKRVWLFVLMSERSLRTFPDILVFERVSSFGPNSDF